MRWGEREGGWKFSDVSYYKSIIPIMKSACGSDGKESTYGTGDAGLIPGSGRSPEKGMATHCSILAQRIPWTEEVGALQSMGSQRVRHDLSD